MRLNPDCVRGILLSVEETCTFDTTWDYEFGTFESEYLAEYSHEEILYHIRQCDRSGFFLAVIYADGGDYVSIQDLSPSGHQFLADIRSDTVWNGVKGIAGKVGSTSLSALAQIATNVITALIKSEFGLSI